MSWTWFIPVWTRQASRLPRSVSPVKTAPFSRIPSRWRWRRFLVAGGGEDRSGRAEDFLCRRRLVLGDAGEDDRLHDPWVVPPPRRQRDRGLVGGPARGARTSPSAPPGRPGRRCPHPPRWPGRRGGGPFVDGARGYCFPGLATGKRSAFLLTHEAPRGRQGPCRSVGSSWYVFTRHRNSFCFQT